MSVEVAFSAGQASSARALILNSDSRAMTAGAAADKVTALLRGAARFAPRWQIKKIDSTLRGNPGAELEAMMTAQGCRVAVVAPAYPAAGRHTRDGRCYVHGIPSITPNLPAIRRRRLAGRILPAFSPCRAGCRAGR